MRFSIRTLLLLTTAVALHLCAARIDNWGHSTNAWSMLFMLMATGCYGFTIGSWQRDNAPDPADWSDWEI